MSALLIQTSVPAAPRALRALTTAVIGVGAHGLILDAPQESAGTGTGEPDADHRPVPEPGADAVPSPAPGAAAHETWARRHEVRSAADGSIAAAWLPGIGYPGALALTADAGRHAPYNLARRVLSVHRSAGGRSGLLLRPGGIDAVTARRPVGEGVPAGRETVPSESAGATDEYTATAARTGRSERWAEYATALRALWESFPEDVLVADQHSGVFARPGALTPVGLPGPAYRIAGPLNIPADGNGTPPLLAEVTGPAAVPLATALAYADALIVDADAPDLAAELLRIAYEQGHAARVLLRFRVGASAESLSDAATILRALDLSHTGSPREAAAARGVPAGVVLEAAHATWDSGPGVLRDRGAVSGAARALQETAQALRQAGLAPAPARALHPATLAQLLQLPSSTHPPTAPTPASAAPSWLEPAALEQSAAHRAPHTERQPS